MHEHSKELLDAGLCPKAVGPLPRSLLRAWRCQIPNCCARAGYECTDRASIVSHAYVGSDFWSPSRIQNLLLVGLFQGYCQFKLDESCQELFTFLTDIYRYGCVHPNKSSHGRQRQYDSLLSDCPRNVSRFVVQGATDMVGWPTWIWNRWTKAFDIVGKCAYSVRKETSEVELKQMQVFTESGAAVFLLEVVWSMIRITKLVNLSSPTNGQELHQFLCFFGWMRSSIHGYNRREAMLTDAMKRAY